MKKLHDHLKTCQGQGQGVPDDLANLWESNIKDNYPLPSKYFAEHLLKAYEQMAFKVMSKHQRLTTLEDKIKVRKQDLTNAKQQYIT